MSELERTHDGLEARVRRAKLLADASMLPEQYRKHPANLLWADELANALGISLAQAVTGITVINGKPTMSAELMRALVIRAGHRFTVEKSDANGCTIAVARREWPNDVQRFQFTMADAKRAKLDGQNWQKFPQAMLLARATTMACRAVFPDVISGVSYDPEEMDEPARITVERTQPMPAHEEPEATTQPTEDDMGVVHSVGPVDVSLTPDGWQLACLDCDKIALLQGDKEAVFRIAQDHYCEEPESDDAEA